MSIRKSYVSDYEQVKNQYVLMGHNNFVKLYRKVEVFIGNTKAIDFINEKLKEGEKAETISR